MEDEAARDATCAATKPDPTISARHAEVRRQVRSRSWGYRVIVLLLVVAVWDMTTKPGL